MHRHPLPLQRLRAILWLAALGAIGGPALAQPAVIRCVDAAGKVSYQAGACAGEARQNEVRLHVAPADPSTAARPSPWKGWKPPAEAYMVFYYDPTGEPVGFSTAQMEANIRTAAAAWSAGCNVRISYAGKAPTQKPGRPDRVTIRWAPEYMQMAHPADARSGIAGTGSLSDGIALKPRFHEDRMLSVLIHEMGHVLGLPHNHEDTSSVMSYLRDEGARRNPVPSASDFLACNLSMKKMFGVEFAAPEGAAAAASRPRMNDRQALEKIHGAAGR